MTHGARMAGPDWFIIVDHPNGPTLTTEAETVRFWLGEGKQVVRVVTRTEPMTLAELDKTPSPTKCPSCGASRWDEPESEATTCWRCEGRT